MIPKPYKSLEDQLSTQAVTEYSPPNHSSLRLYLWILRLMPTMLLCGMVMVTLLLERASWFSRGNISDETILAYCLIFAALATWVFGFLLTYLSDYADGNFNPRHWVSYLLRATLFFLLQVFIAPFFTVIIISLLYSLNI